MVAETPGAEQTCSIEGECDATTSNKEPVVVPEKHVSDVKEDPIEKLKIENPKLMARGTIKLLPRFEALVFNAASKPNEAVPVSALTQNPTSFPASKPGQPCRRGKNSRTRVDGHNNEKCRTRIDGRNNEKRRVNEAKQVVTTSTHKPLKFKSRKDVTDFKQVGSSYSLHIACMLCYGLGNLYVFYLITVLMGQFLRFQVLYRF